MVNDAIVNNEAIDLLCIGNAMVDVFAEVHPGFCKRWKLNDAVQHISPEQAAIILAALKGACLAANAPDIVFTSGGSAANTAKIAAALGLRSAFAGATGGKGEANVCKDRLGKIFEDDLLKEDVKLYLSQKQSPTGIFLSLGLHSQTAPAAFSQKRIIAASPGAALELNENDLDESLFARSRIIMLEGFILDRSCLVRHILEMADKYRLIIALDTGITEYAAKHAGLIHSWIDRYPLILFMNKNEADAFAKAIDPAIEPNSGWENFFAALTRANSGGNTLVTVKLAGEGAAVISGGAVYHVKTDPVNAAETTGAGDAFAAGFLTAFLQGKDPQSCGHAGNAAAAMVLEAPGTSGCQALN